MIENKDRYDEGVRLFNRGKFWHAHEAWEEIWLRSSGDARLVLQALIQLAAAFHHIERGNERGASRLFAAAGAKLERVDQPGLLLDDEQLLTLMRNGEKRPGDMSAPKLKELEDRPHGTPSGWCTKN